MFGVSRTLAALNKLGMDVTKQVTLTTRQSRESLVLASGNVFQRL
jgi:hypothetical protein